ncbi:hypothetical protein F751_5542 [Auxenochlorella protothecoides]|uniref:Uncharacterized protein n=1 Tax=Auxenochlorella protothecoides TaxID=3075 RepID=A0A087SAS9_AUXPR|nr:hypothetical protein F751_5542 [Auxenochlorella protothecoides]KFM22833.1 hypothetical protein F751_5542 [Auxenochlorella protothecoides]
MGDCAFCREGAQSGSPPPHELSQKQALAFWFAAFGTSALIFLQTWSTERHPHTIDFGSGLSRAHYEMLGGLDDISLPAQEAQQRAAAAFDSAVAREVAAPTLTNYTIWLYSVVAADHEGAAILPHWIRHYVGLGIPADKIFLLVHHNPMKWVLALSGLWRVWLGPYSGAHEMRQKLILLNGLVTSLDDWIVVANSDEFQSYGEYSIPQHLAAADAVGATYVWGILRDRLSYDGTLQPLRSDVPIHEQYPWDCAVVGAASTGPTRKVAAYKAFLRTDQEDRSVISPHEAPLYYGAGGLAKDGWQEDGEDDGDLYHLTPYSQYPHRYVTQENALVPKWGVTAAPANVLTFHFKWLASAVQKLRDRLAHHRGSSVRGLLARASQYRETKRVLAALDAGSVPRLDVRAFACRWGSQRPAPRARLALTQREAGGTLVGGLQAVPEADEVGEEEGARHLRYLEARR